MGRVRARFATRCGRKPPIQPRHQAAFLKRCATARLNRRFAAAARRKSRANAVHARTDFWFVRGVRARAICDALRPRSSAAKGRDRIADS
eukprot:10494796-Lingulodinium_polyedra.AAC.1